MSVIQGGEHEEPQRGGWDTQARQVLTTWRIISPVLIGHTADFSDQNVPIIVSQPPVTPGANGMGTAEGRCPSCIAHPVVARGEGQTVLVLVLEHEHGCPELAAIRELLKAGSR
jgi:hypothetical protein